MRNLMQNLSDTCWRVASDLKDADRLIQDQLARRKEDEINALNRLKLQREAREAERQRQPARGNAAATLGFAQSDGSFDSL